MLPVGGGFSCPFWGFGGGGGLGPGSFKSRERFRARPGPWQCPFRVVLPSSGRRPYSPSHLALRASVGIMPVVGSLPVASPGCGSGHPPSRAPVSTFASLSVVSWPGGVGGAGPVIPRSMGRHQCSGHAQLESGHSDSEQLGGRWPPGSIFRAGDCGSRWHWHWNVRRGGSCDRARGGRSSRCACG